MKSTLIALACLTASLSGALPERLFQFESGLVGSPVLKALNTYLASDSAVVFSTADALDSRFLSETKDASYQKYIFYDRAVHIAGWTGGGFQGDFIENAAEFLADEIDGFVIPIPTTQPLPSKSTLEKILTAYATAIQREGDYAVLFAIEYPYARTAFRTAGYENGDFTFTVTSDLQGDSLPYQARTFQRNHERIDAKATVTIDLRNSSGLEADAFTSFLDALRPRKTHFYFSTRSESIAVLADVFDHLNASASGS